MDRTDHSAEYWTAEVHSNAQAIECRVSLRIIVAAGSTDDVHMSDPPGSVVHLKTAAPDVHL